MEHGWAEAIRYDTKLRNAAINRAKLTEQALFRIRDNKKTKRIVYPQMQDAYDYVHNLYPEASIKSVVALHANKWLLDEVGYRGVGGFYDVRTRVIVISDCVSPTEIDEFEMDAEYTLDEVLCHELIHYGANFDKPLSNRNLEEEIAYGKCAGYLKGKGRSDDFIIEKNMMPYLISVVSREEVLNRVLHREEPGTRFDMLLPAAQDVIIEKFRKHLAKEMVVMAKEIGKRMLAMYFPSDDVDKLPIKTQFTGRRNLIIDDE